MGAHPGQTLTLLQATTILDSIADGVFTVDEDMRITYFNGAAERITGISWQEAHGRYCFDVLRADICEKDCAIRSSLDSDSPVAARPATLLRDDGREVPVSISTAVLRDGDDCVFGGVEVFHDLSSIEVLKKEIRSAYTCEDIISKNHRIQHIFEVLPNIAESDAAVLVEGPSGSGKELFARAIHQLSGRRRGPFVAINCGALPDTLLESELFGYVKGAFTDARKDKPGRFAIANGGTLFLDEVESLSPAMQVKLLRVIQEREFEPLGAVGPVRADVRIIAAAKDDLAELVETGRFRDDLFFRLNVVRIVLPPLRERREDIPLLVEHFIELFNSRMGRTIRRAAPAVMATLMRHDFPGNIRELENIIEHAFVMCREDEIRLAHLPDEIAAIRLPVDPRPSALPLEEAERSGLLEALHRHHWNKVETARTLGIHRATLYRKIHKYGLKPSRASL